MSEPIDMDAIRRNYLPEMLGAREDRRRVCKCQAGGVDAVSIDGDWLHVAGEHFTAAVDEVERLTRIVNGYARTPVEQRAADAEVEVERLRSQLAWWETTFPCDAQCSAFNEGPQEDCSRHGRSPSDLWSINDRLRTERDQMADAILAAYDPWRDDDPFDHAHADCPVCRHALGLPEPVDAAGEAGEDAPSDAHTANAQVHPDGGAMPSASAYPDFWEWRPTPQRLEDILRCICVWDCEHKWCGCPVHMPSAAAGAQS